MMMRIFHWLGVIGLAACTETLTPPDKEEAFDFGGVYEETYAGEIDRTVVPRRPDGPAEYRPDNRG